MAAVANVAINVDSRGAVGKLREIQNRTSALDKATQGLTRSLAGLAAGFGATFALGKIISDVAKLDTNLRRLGTVGGDVQGLSKALDQVGKNVEGLAGKAELAAASYQALSAGFTDTAQNARVVEAATKAAVGGLVDVTSVVEVTTKTLNAYGMSGNEAVKVTDSISKAIEFGQVQWSDYTSQLGRVASVAAVAGVSLDEVNAFIAAATKNGATAEIAFTGLGATLSTLLQPTKDSQKAAKELGIAWNLSGLQAKGFDNLIEELGQKMGGNQEAAVRLLGSQEALRGAFAAASKNGSDYRTILEGLGGAAGKTESDFDKMKGSLENQIKALNTAFTALGTKLFEVFGPTLTDLIAGTTTALTNAVDAFNALPEPVKKGTAELVKMIAQLLLVKKAIEGIIALRTAFVAAMVAKAGAIASTGTAAKTSASAFALYTANTKTLQAQAATATPVLRGLLGVLGQLALIGTITIAVNIITTGVQKLMNAKKELEELQGRRAAGGAAAQFAGETRAGGELRQKTARSTIKAIEKERPELQRQIEIFRGLPSGAGRLFTRNLENRLEVLRQREDEARRNLALPLPPEPPKPSELPTPPIDIDGGGKGKGKGKRDKAADELKRQREAGIELLTQQERQIKLKLVESSLEKELLQVEYDRLDALKQIGDIAPEQRDEATRQANTLAQMQAGEAIGKTLAEQVIKEQELQQARKDALRPLEQQRELLEAKLNGTEKEFRFRQQVDEIMNQAPGLERATVEELLRGNDALEKRVTQMQEMKQLLGAAAQSVKKGLEDALVSTIEAAVTGSKDLGETLKEIASGVLKDIGRMFIRAGINAAFSGLGFADGGRPPVGQISIVGERGPELFVPDTAGTVIPNEQLSSAMSRYRRSGTTATNETMAAMQGGEGGTAVMDKPIDVRYSVDRINNVDYVTAEQFQQGMRQAAQQGAQRGEQQTIKRLQMSSSTRKRLGL